MRWLKIDWSGPWTTGWQLTFMGVPIRFDDRCPPGVIYFGPYEFTWHDDHSDTSANPMPRYHRLTRKDGRHAG